MIEDARRSVQTVTSDGDLVRRDVIEGLRFKEVRNVLSRAGVLTELWRPEWFGPESTPGHVAYITLPGQCGTNWHYHKKQNDLIFVVRGIIKIAFYDGRETSRTHKKLNVYPFSPMRPTLIGVPPGVWHVLKNTTVEEAAFVTMNDTPFNYENPDDWKLLPGDPELPEPF